MAELHCNFYFRHPDSRSHQQLMDMFRTIVMYPDEQAPEILGKFVDAARLIKSDNGESLAKDLIETVTSDLYDELRPESLEETAGYGVAHWVSGSSGDDIQEELMKFIHALCPDVHAQSWGCGDDDPWEFWFKFDDGKVLRCDDEPFEDYDDRIMGTIYRWWHSDMPAQIKEGFLKDKYQDEDDDTTDWREVTDIEYSEWLSNLRNPSAHSESGEGIFASLLFGEDEEEAGGSSFERVGPELSNEQIGELRQICRDILSLQDPAVEDYLKGYAKISTCLVGLEQTYNSGLEMAEENAAEFLELWNSFKDEIRQEPIHGFLCTYYRDSIMHILDERRLGTIILRHDEAFTLSSVLVGLYEEGSIEETYPNSMSSYQDFLVWKNMLVTLAEQ